MKNMKIKRPCSYHISNPPQLAYSQTISGTSLKICPMKNVIKLVSYSTLPKDEGKSSL